MALHSCQRLLIVVPVVMMAVGLGVMAAWCGFLAFYRLKASKEELEQKLEDANTKLEQTSTARWYPIDFHVATVVKDDRKIIVVQCPGIGIHDIRVEYYDSCSRGKIQIDRKEALGVLPMKWEHAIHFDSHYEFLPSETRFHFEFDVHFAINT